MIIDFNKRLLQKHLDTINILLSQGAVKEAEDYRTKLPINMKIKINHRLKHAKTN